MSRSKTAHVLNQASKAVQSKFSETWMEGASKQGACSGFGAWLPPFVVLYEKVMAWLGKEVEEMLAFCDLGRVERRAVVAGKPP